MNKTLFQSFLLSALMLLNAPAYAYQYVEWSSLPTFRVLEWCTTSGETDADVPTDEYNSLMEQAEALASDDDAVAVGKLRKAIQWAKDNNDESQLQAAIDQFLADNADLVKDETARVGTKMADWNVGSGNNSQKATYSHNGITLIEHFGETRVGIMLSQEVSVENGTYNIELYATSHNAWNGQYMPVSADNPAPSLQADANDVAYVFGSSLGVTEQTWITARRNSGMSSFEPETYAINGVQVFDEKLLIGLALAKAGQTEWHTIQIKSLKWITTAKQAYAAAKSRLSSLVAEGLILFRDENKTNGKEVFTAYLKRAEETMYFSSNFNIPELEAVVAELKDAIADFRRANYYIDFAAGEYYILDGESRLMIAAGNEWGTHGIVNEQGLDLILTPNTTNRSVSINSRVTNGGYQQYLGSNLYMDSDEYGWFFDKQGSGFYIANSEGQYINIDSNNNLVMSNTPHEWIIVPKDELMQERMKALESATQNNPVDATFLLQNPTFNRNDMRTEAWEVGGNCTDKTLGGPLYDKVENYCAESYHSTFTISQTIADAPAGVYQLTAQGFYRQEDGVTEDAPKFFIGSETAELPAIAGSENSMADAGASFYMGRYTIEPITFVYDGNGGLTVGIEGTATHQWVAFDNFQLSYLGKAETPQEHEYVDLGLPSGTLWATCNVGANSPEEYGDYFAWGETTPKEDFDNFESYRISDYILAKYNVDGGTGILTSLQPEDDAATVNWGSDWQMPSEAQILELISEEYTTSEWTQLNGVNGRLITSKSNGNSIFLPAAGNCLYGKSGEGEKGNYWSRILNPSYQYASEIYFTSSLFAHYLATPKFCLSVRPVRYTEPILVSSIDLSNTLLRMEVDTYWSLTSTLEPANADNGYLRWKSSDTNVATVYGGKVQAKSVGTCTITCYATDGSGVKAECQLTVFEPEEHDYVDLGLPSGTLWATCNVGAENPEDYGDYFAWGETQPKEDYSWGTYFDTEDGGDTFKKYDVGMTEVLPEDDAATVIWGSEWQMPSYSQIEELINSEYTTTEWTQVNGVNGWKITSKSNGNSIFLAAAGFFNDTNHNGAGSYGHYLSRSLYANSSGIACGLYFYSGNIFIGSYNRCYGQTVRPVRKKEVYAELAEETGTMTFYYDYQRTSRSGETKLYDPANRVSSKFGNKVLKADIDPSMKEATLTSMEGMFSGCTELTSIEGLENLNMDNVTDISFMFYGCSKLKSLDLSSFNTSNVTRMYCMFEDCSSLQIIDLTSFDITNVTNMKFMFNSCSELTTICCFGDWSTSNANSGAMFQGCDKLVGGKGTLYNYSFVDKTYARPDGGTGSPGYFTADTMTGIKAIDNGQRTTDDRFYEQGSTIVNLAGQRIGKMQKGIYIVNGKKVAVK
ncbi:MAG: BspA family leucine-rich repeat surface protein [Bacteroidaceae bacterium]|nr:BspA family leucine-rich repeat surface protein [Bacteroidaceae bacterium]